MLADQEKSLQREKRITTVMWIYIVLLTTCLMTGSGLLMIHKIEGTWMAVTPSCGSCLARSSSLFT